MAASGPVREQGCMDRLSSVLAEVTGLSELFPGGDDDRLHRTLGAVDRPEPSSGLTAPVNAVQSLPARVPDPPLNH
jgi:hypothetical protein